MNRFANAYYCGMEFDREAYDAREEMIEARVPAPTPEGFEKLRDAFKALTQKRGARGVLAGVFSEGF
jgi:hypothetical protein